MVKTKILSLFAGTLVILTAAVYVIFFVGSQIFYDFSFKLPFTKSVAANQNVVTSSGNGLVQGTAVQGSNTQGSPIINSGDFKPYASNLGFSLSYPKNWGLLTCANSYNFELDPTNGTDLPNIICDSATKPISVILNKDLNGCGGETVRIGNVDVLKSQITTQNYTTYQWCTITNPSLIISNRTSSTTNFAATTTNYAGEIERIIGSLVFTR